MGFSIVEGGGRTLWVPADSSSTYYMGQLVAWNGDGAVSVGGAVTPLATADGAADTTNLSIPAGVVVGFNERTPVYSTTYAGLQESTGIITQAAQATRLNTGITGAEGMYPKNDTQPLIQIATINPGTIIRGKIYNATWGTACAVQTDSAGTDTTGYTTAGTTNAAPFTPVADICTIYCRTGANAGIYRVTNDTSTTAPDTTVAFPYDVALGDTFVRVPFKVGLSFMNFLPDNVALFVNQAASPATNYFTVIVYKMDLSTSGREYVEFAFGGDHFCVARA